MGTNDRHAARARAGVLGLGWILCVGPVRAQCEPTHPPEAPELSEAELRALTEALGRDAADVHPAHAVEHRPGATGAGSSMNPDISAVLSVAAAAYSNDSARPVGGHDPSQNGFNFQQLELTLSSNVDPWFRFDGFLAFSPGGVELEEAYATTLALPGNLQARAGQFLTRFGRLNGTHPHAWEFLDQPLALGKMLGPEGGRGVGVEVSWLSPLPWYVELLGSATGAAGACCARSFTGGDDLGVDGPADLLYTTALKQFFPLSDAWSLLWGLSAQHGPNATGNENRSAIYGTDLYLRWRPPDSPNRTAVSLQVEGLYRARQVPRDNLRDAGGYAQLVWEIDAEWAVGARSEYVSGLRDDPLDPEWVEARLRHAAQVTWYPSHFSRLRLQGALDDPRWLDEPVWAAMLGLEVIVGAHGAHEF